MGLFTLFHLTLGPHKFKHPIMCNHTSENLVTHSHKDPQSQLHILSHSLTVSHAPANVAMHSHKDASHTVANLQFHTQPHTTIIQPLTIIYPTYILFKYDSTESQRYTVPFILYLTIAGPQGVINTRIWCCRFTHLQTVHTLTRL